jgi:peptidylprolyl isomerase
LDPGREVSLGALLLAALLSAGCGVFADKSPKIRKGSMVRIHYTLEVDGKTIDDTRGRGPLEFQEGSGRVIQGLEEQVMGLSAGGEKTFTVPPEKGYGLRDPGAVRRLPLSRFGAQAAKLRPGESVRGTRGGRPATARVLALDRGYVTLDFNHPYAGKILTFKVKVIGVGPGGPSRRRT